VKSSTVSVVEEDKKVTLNEHELKVNQELLKWSQEEFQKFLLSKSSNVVAKMEVLQNILFK
jgi:hypothetical protein